MIGYEFAILGLNGNRNEIVVKWSRARCNTGNISQKQNKTKCAEVIHYSKDYPVSKIQPM